MNSTEKWLYALLSAFITGAASGGLSWVGLAVAHASGVDVPLLNFKALGIVMVSAGIPGALAYLKQSPLPPIEEKTVVTVTETKTKTQEQNP